MATKNLQFVPGYYEWHLTDKNGNVLHNMTDPSDSLFGENGEPLNYDEITDLCASDLLSAEFYYADGKEYNGVFNENGWTAKEIQAASLVMATALYNYYFA